jgi:hypothetical protein
MSKKAKPILAKRTVRPSIAKTQSHPSEGGNVIPIGTWVTHMHEYYQANGHYRPADLNRLLGDPRERAEISSSSALPLASLLIKP